MHDRFPLSAFRPLTLLAAVLLLAGGCAGLPGSRGRFPHSVPRSSTDLPGADTPVRIMLEAEDFSIRQGDWQIVPYRENYFASTFAITFLSRQALLGAPEQVETVAIAEQSIVIPYDDDYHVLARYEQPYNFSCEFTIEIEQAGQIVYRADYGRLDDPKVWPMNARRRVPMERYFWGGTDNIVWQHFDPIPLRGGPATVRLLAGPQNDGDTPRVNAARRHVDVIAITNDREGMQRQQQTRYLEFDGWLLQDGDVFARVTNLGDEPRIITLAPHNTGQHSPYYIHVRDWGPTHITRDGIIPHPLPFAVMGPRDRQVDPRHLAPLDPDSDLPARNQPHADRGLQPGQTSGWIPIGHMLDALHNSKWLFNPRTPVHLELAKPNGRGGLTVLWKGEIDSATTFEMPNVANPSPALDDLLADTLFAPVVRTDAQALQWLRDQIRAFPAAGKVPDRLLLYNVMGTTFAWNSPNPDVREAAREIAILLGDNTAVDRQGQRRRMQTHWRSTDLDAIQRLKDEGRFEDLFIVSYGDEIHLPALTPTAEEFSAFLEQHAVPGRETARYTTDRDDPWFYYSRLAGFEKGIDTYAAATAFYGEHGILTGANYSPHANYLVTEIQYIRTFKDQAMSMPWSEDYIWQIPEFSIQAMGWLTSALRAGARYHDMPVQMYVMPHSPGNTPTMFRLSFYNAIAHGATIINYFCASPLATAITENYVATQDLDMWRAVHDVSHQAGMFEDYILDGRVRPARVALLLSSVDDILTGVTNQRLAMHNNERKAIYYAARHAQIPIDFLTEDDLIDGLAADYDLLFVAQEYLHSRAVDAMRQWVEAGGTLVALAGGGFKDEFQRDNPAARSLFGVREQQRLTDPQLDTILGGRDLPFLSKQDLPLYEPFDTVTWNQGDLAGTQVGVIAWKQTLVPDEGDVLAVFADGSPAAVAKNHGDGRAVLLGFLPGQDYLKSGLPIRPVDRGSTDDAFTHYQPTGMDTRLRRLLVDQWLPADFIRPVSCNVPMVEATVIDTQAPDSRLAVPLMNFTGQPIERLSVTIPGIERIRAIRSVEQETVTYRIENGTLVVELPLELTDMLLIDLY